MKDFIEWNNEATDPAPGSDRFCQMLVEIECTHPYPEDTQWYACVGWKEADTGDWYIGNGADTKLVSAAGGKAVMWAWMPRGPHSSRLVNPSELTGDLQKAA